MASKRRGPRLSLGPFDLEARVGVGAFGEVFRARHRRSGEVVAVKCLKPSAERDVALLKREFRRAADLTHPHLVRLYELYTEGDDCFYSMELLEGCHLSAQTLDQPVTTELIGSVLVQGASALAEIHEAGMVHRDLKPSNMILTRAGRLVVLDFGLLERIGHQGPGFYGSYHFAAPEVVDGGTHTRASDWYGLGAVVRELWHGAVGESLAPTVPLPGRPRVADDRLAPIAERPVPIPEPWGSLLSALTATAPEERPGYREIVAIAGAAGISLPTPVVAPSAAPGSGTGDEPLVGRAQELSELRSFVGGLGPPAPRVAYLRAPSGVGKSAILRRLGAELREQRESLATAYSACREGDRTAYRVLDAAFDDLVPRPTRPARATPDERAALGVLARMLPSLDRAGVGDPSDAPALDAPSLWRLAVAGLRLALRLPVGGRVALLLDDLQWGDEESGRLLADALAEGDLPVALVFAMRPEEEALSPFLEVFRERARQSDLTARTIDLGPLEAEDALALARHLAHTESSGDDIARLAHGNPFLIELLAQTNAAGMVADGSLREVIGRIVEALPDPQREALAVLSLASGPLPSELLEEVVGPDGTLRPTLRSLRDQRLVRTAGPPEARVVNTYHDSVREAVRDRLGAETRQRIHRGLAQRLAAQPGCAHAVVGYHYREAGDIVAAAPHLVEAAREASRALALRRAVELMEQAIEGTTDPALLAELEREHVLLLAAAGLSERAGATAEALLARQPEHRDALRRLAVEQFFVGGHVDRGRPLAMEMLDESGRRWPTDSLANNATLSFHIARTTVLAAAVNATRRRLASGRMASSGTAMDFAVGRGLASYDPLVGSIFLLRATASALRERDLDIAAIGLAYTGALVGFSGARRATQLGLKLIEWAQSHSRSAGYVRGDAFSEVSRGVVRACQGRWRESVDCFDRGVARLDQECSAADWEANNGKNTSLFSLMNLCELKELGRRVQRYTSEARDRSDLALEVESGLYRTFHLLAEDDPREAAENARERISRWTDSGYHFQHWIAARLEAHRACYEGAGPADLEHMQSALRAATRARLTFMQVVRSEGNTLVGRLALSRMASEGPSASLTRVARDAIVALDREQALHAKARAASLRAGLALAHGDTSAAVGALRVARAAFGRAQMAGEALAHARRIAELTGAGARELDALDDRLRTLGVRAPERWVSMLVPVRSA